ncbi:MAG: Arc family DNA-binding protein [Acidobacteria bacterium]|nr:Arc family DNA-binding protein [Acidobacteriota bacterium]
MSTTATVTVKEIPVGIHESLKKLAEENGQSLNSYILSLLVSTAEEKNRRLAMKASRDEYRKFLDAIPPVSDSVELIREGRD